MIVAFHSTLSVHLVLDVPLESSTIYPILYLRVKDSDFIDQTFKKVFLIDLLERFVRNRINPPFLGNLINPHNSKKHLTMDQTWSWWPLFQNRMQRYELLPYIIYAVCPSTNSHICTHSLAPLGCISFVSEYTMISVMVIVTSCLDGFNTKDPKTSRLPVAYRMCYMHSIFLYREWSTCTYFSLLLRWKHTTVMASSAGITYNYLTSFVFAKSSGQNDRNQQILGAFLHGLIYGVCSMDPQKVLISISVLVDAVDRLRFVKTYWILLDF